LIQFVNILKEITGVEYEIVEFPDDKKIIDIGDYYGDYSFFNKDTGWNPKVNLVEGISKTIDFYNCYKKEYWM
jgi:nucleoside-diphosphate-sugar epimerase